jgi:DNA-binding XRE family transcriptional regulator
MSVRVNGRLIKELRIRHSYSQEKLAAIVGVNLRTIQRIEVKGVASLDTRGALASAFSVQPEDLDARESPVDAAAIPTEPTEPADRRSRWALRGLSAGLVLVGVIVLAVSINTVTPIGLLAMSALGGMLTALIGFILLTLVTPLPRWRTYVVLSIVGLSLVAAPPAWTARALLVISLWAAFELGVLATRLRFRTRLAAGRDAD